jgi:hypothetical protein
MTGWMLGLVIGGLAACVGEAGVEAEGETTGNELPVPPGDEGEAEYCPPALPDDIGADRRAAGTLIVIWKSHYKLGFYEAGRLVEQAGSGDPTCFDVALGFEPEGHKTVRGDGKTPEGWYWVSWKIPLGKTSFYKALYVNYPNAEDAAAGLAAGRVDQATHDRIVQRAAKRSTVTDSKLGSLIEIHGEGSWPRNWTLGCVALDNPDMDWLYDASIGGKTAIRILP